MILVVFRSIHAEHRPSPRHYKGELDSSVAVRSLTFCPFGGEQFFLAGCDDGSVRLHSVTSEKPLITWPGTVDGQPILQIIWSPSRPCVFVILDVQSRIHLWDLGSGDIYPAHTVQLKSITNDFSMNTQNDLSQQQRQLLVIASDDGVMYIHLLTDEYVSGDKKSCKKELARFLHYVSII